MVRSEWTWIATLAGFAAVAGSFAVAGSTPEFVVAPINEFVVTVSPAELVAFSIQTLGHLGDLLAFALSLVLTVALFAVATWIGARVGRYTGIRFAPQWGVGWRCGSSRSCLRVSQWQRSQLRSPPSPSSELSRAVIPRENHGRRRR